MIDFNYYRKLMKTPANEIPDKEKELLSEFISKYGELPLDPVFNVASAILAQKKYCVENEAPDFAPLRTGKCFRCNRQIFAEGGVSVQKATTELITGCPFCHYSYCD